jgi:tRNA threonylcarbamoyladenosine biosynthesis protein TsaB
MLLAIDTSTRTASVALFDGTRVVASRSWWSVVNHSAELMPAVVQVLRSREVSPCCLDAVAVALGPGGFSALRTGLSAAKGMAMASRIPIIGVNSLELEAYPFRATRTVICALLEAGRGEAASALVSHSHALNRLRDDRISGPVELLDEIESLQLESTLFCGEGLLPWAEMVRERLGQRALLCQVPASARAESLASLAWTRLEEGSTDDLDLLQPHYLRMPSIGAPKRRDRRRQASATRPFGSRSPDGIGHHQ